MSINTNISAVINGFADQMKQVKDRVSPEEWNSLWNIISSQANINALFINELKNFIIGNSKGIVEVPQGYESLLDFIIALSSDMASGQEVSQNTDSLMWTSE
jgi:hypothetical protein